MSAGSFKADMKNTWKSCLDCDDDTVSGAAGAGWSVVNCMVPAAIWHFCMIPANNTGGDILPFGVAALGGFCAIVPCAVTFLILLVPGGLAAGCGALYGLIRK